MVEPDPFGFVISLSHPIIAPRRVEEFDSMSKFDDDKIAKLLEELGWPSSAESPQSPAARDAESMQEGGAGEQLANPPEGQPAPLAPFSQEDLQILQEAIDWLMDDLEEFQALRDAIPEEVDWLVNCLKNFQASLPAALKPPKPR